jgi:hypothetical protein
VFFSSGEGLQPRPFVRFGRVMACFFSARHGTSAFAIFKVIDRDLHAIFKVERSPKFKKHHRL